MALDLGQMLQGSIGLDTGRFSAGLDDAMGKLGDFAGKGAKVAAAAGAGVATAMAASLVANLSVEKGTDKLAAQLGLTEAESKRVGAVAGSLYADAYGENLDQVNDAVGAVMSSIAGMSDASGARLEKVTAKALDFATVFEVDVQRAAQVAGQAVETGLAKNATQAFDLITAASQRVPASLREDVLDAADEYGQFFAQLGMDGPEAFGLLVNGAQKGMYGIDKAGDAIKEFTIRSTDMSTASKDAYKAIGLDARQMADDILAGGDKAKGATDKILEGLLSMKPGAKQANAAIALFGTPLEDLGTKDIPKFLESLRGGNKAMKGFGGASERMGDTLNDNASTALTGLRRKGEKAFLMLGNWALPIVNDMADVLGEKFGPALSAVADFLTARVLPAVRRLGRFIADNQTPIMIISGLILAVFIPHLIALGLTAVKTRVKVVASWLMMRGAAVKAALVHSGAIVKMIAKWALLGAKSLIHAGKVAAAWLIAIGPIGIVIAAVVGLAVVIFKNWDRIKDATSRAWGWVVDKVAGAWDKVWGATTRIGGQVLGWFRDLPGRIVDAVSGAASKMVEVGKSIVTGIWDGIKSMGSWLKETLIGWVKDIIPGPIAKALGISSPSRVMRDLARWIPTGIALGIEDELPRVRRASDRMAAATRPNLSDLGPRRGGGGPDGAAAAGGGRPIYVTTSDPLAAAHAVVRLEAFAGVG